MPSPIFLRVMRKTYGMKGVSECVFRIPVGKSTIVCTFTDGNLQSRVPAPATFSTENPIVQTIIESCEMFANNKIYLMSVSGEVVEANETNEAYEDVKVSAKKTTKKTTKASTTRVMEEVHTYGDAITALMTESEVNVAELTDVAACKAKAAEIGISFPNLK